MKRSISVLLSLLLVLSLTACVSLKTPNAPAARPETGSEAATSASTPAEAPAAEPEAAEAPAPEDVPADEPESQEAPAPEDAPADEPESQDAPAPEDAPADEPGSKDAPAPEDAPADEPGSKDAPAPEDAPADEPGSKDAPAPEDAPADEPADADAPFGEAVKTAAQQLAQAQSMHIDMKLDINPELTVPMGEMEQHVPMDVGMIWRIDYANAPLQIRLDFGLSAVGKMHVSGNVYPLGAEPVCLSGGHGAVDAELTRLIGAGIYDASGGNHTDYQGLSPVFGMVALLH